jgi:hypothetical protein
MSQSETYTYRAGQKLPLEKRPDQFVVRALPGDLTTIGIVNAEQVSSASSRVTTRAADLEPLMSRSRHLAPTHHAYYVAETSEEFLITDRVLVSFHEALSPEEVAAFAGRYGLVQKAAYSDRDFLFQLTDHTGMNPVKLVVRLNEKEPLVASAEHDLNQRMTKYQFALPTDPAYSREWHLHTHLNAADFDPRSSSRSETAWQLIEHFGSAEVVVSITDDGCKLDHTDFNSPGKFAGWGYMRGARLITIPILGQWRARCKQDADHGTACAGSSRAKWMPCSRSARPRLPLPSNGNLLAVFIDQRLQIALRAQLPRGQGRCALEFVGRRAGLALVPARCPTHYRIGPQRRPPRTRHRFPLGRRQ